MSVHPVRRVWLLRIVDCDAHYLAAHHATQLEPAHQPLDRAAGHDNTYACQLAPHFSALDLCVGLPDTFNLWYQHLLAMSSGTALVELA